MTDAVIVSTARTGLTKSWRGSFNMTHGAVLGGHVVEHAVQRAKIDPAEIEDVIMGCANPEGATGLNIARQIAIKAGLPVSVGGVTINRFCSSGLQAIAMAAQRVIVDQVPIMVGGGVESISCVQQEMNQHMLLSLVYKNLNLSFIGRCYKLLSRLRSVITLVKRCKMSMVCVVNYVQLLLVKLVYLKMKLHPLL